MLIEHAGMRPTLHPSARVAPNATLCGDVTVGAGTSIGFGAVLTAETGAVSVGARCVIMEQAVLRGTGRAPLVIGDHVLVGPHAHLSGCTVGDNVFVATHASVFPHAVVGAGSTIRIGAVVHIRTVLQPGTSLPIGWIAAGDPPELYPPGEGRRILEHLARLDFTATVFGVEREADLAHMPRAMQRYARALARHRDDHVLPRADGDGRG
jgi:carbonic anhydrase/acetyltransferase-like protein (isoleucine patch superfamily)